MSHFVLKSSNSLEFSLEIWALLKNSLKSIVTNANLKSGVSVIFLFYFIYLFIAFIYLTYFGSILVLLCIFGLFDIF